MSLFLSSASAYRYRTNNCASLGPRCTPGRSSVMTCSGEFENQNLLSAIHLLNCKNRAPTLIGCNRFNIRLNTQLESTIFLKKQKLIATIITYTGRSQARE